MIKKRLKNWFVATSLIFVLGVSIYSYACSDGWWSYSSTSSFTPEAFADKSYKPLFFSPYDRFYNGAYMYDNGGMFNDEIVTDWYNYLGGAVKKDVVEKYLLKSDEYEEELASMFSDWSKKKNVTSVNKWNLKDPKLNNFVGFLYYAKTIENYSNPKYNYWDYDSHVAVYMDAQQVEKVEKYYKKIQGQDIFFTNRMWFQVMKAKFYSNDKSAVISFYNETGSKQPKNTLAYRAIGYLAGAYYAQGNYDKSNALYADIFNNSPELRQIAAYNYKAMSLKDLHKLCSTSTDNGVKTALWAMQGYYNNANLPEAMKEIYAIDSKSPHINYLLTRWVNTQEAAVLQYNDETFKTSKDYFGRIKNKIDAKTLKWVNTVAEQPEKLDNPVLWTLAGSYLDIFQGNYKEVSAALDKAKMQAKDNALVLDQIRLFELINTVSQVKKVDAKTESLLLNDYAWLVSKSKAENAWEDPLRLDYALSWTNQFLSAIYKEQGNLVMAEVMNSSTSFYKEEVNTSKMEKFFLKKDKTAFENLALKYYNYSIGDIYECRAINLFYQDRLDEAIVEMKKAKPVDVIQQYSNDPYLKEFGYVVLAANPFNGKIQDCNDCDYMAKQSVRFTKVSFMEKMKEMKDKIAKGEDVYNNALLLGNAFYNASYYGNARLFYQNDLMNEYGNYLSDSGKKVLMNMELSRKYYALAKKHATNKEQKAKLAYLEAKLERNDYYRTTFFSRDYYYGGGYDSQMVKKWKGFQELSNEYSDTKYYQDVIRECGYFRTYLGM